MQFFNEISTSGNEHLNQTIQNIRHRPGLAAGKAMIIVGLIMLTAGAVGLGINLKNDVRIGERDPSLIVSGFLLFCCARAGVLNYEIPDDEQAIPLNPQLNNPD